MAKTMTVYDGMRQQARELGERRVDFTFQYDTSEERLTTEMVIEEIENRYRPRDGPPTLIRLSVVNMKNVSEHINLGIKAYVITMRVRAKINRFIFHADPDRDKIDLTGVGN